MARVEIIDLSRLSAGQARPGFTTNRSLCLASEAAAFHSITDNVMLRSVAQQVLRSAVRMYPLAYP